MSEDEGVRITSAEVTGYTVTELGFPPHYVQQAFEPELPYLALVLEGGMEKTFALRTMSFDRASALTMPAGARHGARFGSKGARILIVKPIEAVPRLSGPARRAPRPGFRLAGLSARGRAAGLGHSGAARGRRARPAAARRGHA